MYNHSLVLKASVCSLSSCHHRAFMGSKSSRQPQTWRQSVHKFRAASCHCFASCHCSASCHCCHDPFIVRSAQTRLPFTGFTQLCTSVSTFTINVDNCLFVCCRFPCTFFLWSVLVSPGLQPHHQIHHRLVTVILQWSVGSMVSRIPILQTCNVAAVLKHRLASFQPLRSSLLHAPS